MKLFPWSTLAVGYVFLALFTPVSASQDDDLPPVQVTLHPAAEPRPAMKYLLLPRLIDRIPGNAAVYFGKVTPEQQGFFGDRELREKIHGWRNAPLDELRGNEVRLEISTIYYFLDRAARCSSCDWQLPIRDEPFYSILLPDLQQTREFGRILAAKARIHIARGQFDDAVKTLETGYAIARHVADGETIINGLVGMGISTEMSKQVLELIQQPGSPNLYWALTTLPRPLIDMRKGVEAEMDAVELSFPELRDLDRATRSPDAWRDTLHRFTRQLVELIGDDRQPTSPEAITALSVRGYPRAKRWLVANGMPAETVEQMPVAQVVFLYSMQTYHELRDDICKWFFVPYPDARAGLKAAEDQLRSASRDNREIIPIASLVLPAVGSVQTAYVRTDRQIALLRVIEALRIYGASHAGQLPETLGEITAVHVPNDPVTGKPFSYHRQGNTAYLQGPALPRNPLNYEITMKEE